MHTRALNVRTNARPPSGLPPPAARATETESSGSRATINSTTTTTTTSNMASTVVASPTSTPPHHPRVHFGVHAEGSPRRRQSDISPVPYRHAQLSQRSEVGGIVRGQGQAARQRFRWFAGWCRVEPKQGCVSDFLFSSFLYAILQVFQFIWICTFRSKSGIFIPVPSVRVHRRRKDSSSKTETEMAELEGFSWCC